MNMQPALLEVNGGERSVSMKDPWILIGSIDHQVRTLLSLTGYLEQADAPNERVESYIRQRLGYVQTELEVICSNIGKNNIALSNDGDGPVRTVSVSGKNLKGGDNK